MTEPVGGNGRRGGQIREMDVKLHPDLKEALKKLSDDPKTTIVVLSGSDRSVLDEVLFYFLSYTSSQCPFNYYYNCLFGYVQNFGEFNMWLAAENGMFLRLTSGEWMTTMPENLNMEWVDSVKVGLHVCLLVVQVKKARKG